MKTRYRYNGPVIVALMGASLYLGLIVWGVCSLVTL